MNWCSASEVVELLRAETRLYLPALSHRRGFSSSRVEYLLSLLVNRMPETECYLEVGTLEGRTLEAAAHKNATKQVIGCDPCQKYDIVPDPFPSNVMFVQSSWQELLEKFEFPNPIGVCFYDGDHSAVETYNFMRAVEKHMSEEAVLVLDDWDRETVRAGAFRTSSFGNAGWRLLREMPEYTDGLTTAQHHFGYSFGVAVWGYRR